MYDLNPRMERTQKLTFLCRGNLVPNRKLILGVTCLSGSILSDLQHSTMSPVKT